MVENEGLFPVKEAEYGERYKADFMTQYRDFVASANQISAKRHQANQFFSSINTVLLMGSGFIPGKEMALHWQVVIAGALLCVIWRRMIMAYSDLNSAKFKVILAMEENLPVAVYKTEWQHIKKAKGKTLSSIESLVPRLFIAAYILVYITNVLSTGGMLDGESTRNIITYWR